MEIIKLLHYGWLDKLPVAGYLSTNEIASCLKFWPTGGQECGDRITDRRMDGWPDIIAIYCDSLVIYGLDYD